MTGQHFKEILESVCMSTGCTKAEIAILIGILPNTISIWQRTGVSKTITPYVMSVLRAELMGRLSA